MKNLFQCLGVIACACLMSCSTFNLQEPKISVKSVDIQQFDLSHIQLNVVARVHNPNSIAIKLDKIDYVFMINDVELMHDVWVTPIQVGPGASELVKIPVRLSMMGALTVAKSVMSKMDHSYRFKGSIHIANLPFPIKFDRSDSLSLN